MQSYQNDNVTSFKKEYIVPYSKYEPSTVQRALKTKKISKAAQQIYFLLTTFLNTPNSCSVEATYAAIQDIGGIHSQSTVRKAIKELSDTSFIEIIQRNGFSPIYVLLIGFYNGKKELIKGDVKKDHPLQKNDTPPVQKIIRGKIPIIYNKKEITTTRTPNKPNPVVVVPIAFSENSPFEEIPKTALQNLITKYGPNKVQDCIAALEKRYTNGNEPNTTKKVIDSNPAGLVFNALKNEYVFKDLESKTEVANKERIKRLELYAAQYCNKELDDE
jgi:hypothetical protein